MLPRIASRLAVAAVVFAAWFLVAGSYRGTVGFA